MGVNTMMVKILGAGSSDTKTPLICSTVLVGVIYYCRVENLVFTSTLLGQDIRKLTCVVVVIYYKHKHDHNHNLPTMPLPIIIQRIHFT